MDINSTTEKLSQRMARHRRDCKSYLYKLNQYKSPKAPSSLHESFDEFDIENRIIVLIEEYPCQNRKQPEKKEGEYNENDKNCPSKCIVGRTRKEYCDARREHHL